MQAVEQALGIRFPNDFRQIAMAHQGQVPRPNTFAVGKRKRFQLLIHFSRCTETCQPFFIITP